MFRSTDGGPAPKSMEEMHAHHDAVIKSSASYDIGNGHVTGWHAPGPMQSESDPTRGGISNILNLSKTPQGKAYYRAGADVKDTTDLHNWYNHRSEPNADQSFSKAVYSDSSDSLPDYADPKRDYDLAKDLMPHLNSWLNDSRNQFRAAGRRFDKLGGTHSTKVPKTDAEVGKDRTFVRELGRGHNY